jgi:hypothetical protein
LVFLGLGSDTMEFLNITDTSKISLPSKTEA